MQDPEYVLGDAGHKDHGQACVQIGACACTDQRYCQAPGRAPAKARTLAQLLPHGGPRAPFRCSTPRSRVRALPKGPHSRARGRTAIVYGNVPGR